LSRGELAAVQGELSTLAAAMLRLLEGLASQHQRTDASSLGSFQLGDGSRQEPDPLISAAAAAAIAVATQGRMEGVVAEWNGSPGAARGGYGFIHFSDGRRAYAHNSQCGGAALLKGQAVTADVVEDPKNPGKWQAQSVVIVAPGGTTLGGSLGLGSGPSLGGGGALSSASAFGGAALGGAGLAGSSSLGSSPSGSSASASLVRSEGVVTQWNEKGFGFIQFQDGRFAYVHNSACGGQHLMPGEAVSAIIVEDSKNPGKLAAQEVQRRLQSEDAVVVEWNESGGFGFMQTDDGRQAYVHRSVLGGLDRLVVGLRLRVTTAQDSRNPGRWCVAELVGAPKPGMDAAQQESRPPERCSGTVVQWDHSGFGLLLMEDGRHAEVHDALQLKPGDIVSASLSPDPFTPGKFVAHGLEVGPDNVRPYLGEEGTVTEWHENSGYGFILLHDGRKLYVHRSAFGGTGGLMVGSRLRVAVKPDTRNPGKWCAAQVIAADGTVLGNQGDLPPSRGSRAGPGSGAGALARVAAPAAAAPAASAATPASAALGALGNLAGIGNLSSADLSTLGAAISGLLNGLATGGTTAVQEAFTEEPAAKRQRVMFPQI